MKKLKKAGIVASRQGVDGGYRLGRDPSAISYYDVIEAVEDGIFISRCLKNPIFCNANRLPECAVHYGLAEVQESLVRELKAKNFGAPSHRK